VYTMTNNSNDVIAPTAQAAMLAITLTLLPCSKAALPFASPFLVFTSLHLAEICTITSTF